MKCPHELEEGEDEVVNLLLRVLRGRLVFTCFAVLLMNDFGSR